MSKNIKDYKVLIAIPCMRTICTEFFMSIICMKNNGNTIMSVAANSLVYDARNTLVKKAIEENCDYIWFVDSDMVFDPDAMNMLLQDAIDNDYQFVTGLCFRRTLPTSPTLAKTMVWYQDEKGIPHGAAETYKDYPRDQLFEIAGSGLACTIVKLSALGEAANRYKMSPFEPLPNLSEDYSFCFRLKDMGIKMYCDSRVKVGHVGNLIFNEETYLNQDEQGEEES